MKFLLFLLGIIFYFIFFLFSQKSDIQGMFIGNLFLEAHAYLLVSIICIITLIVRSRKRTERTDSEKKQYFDISQENLTKNVKSFFQSYVYYIACILFYISLFGVFHVFLGKTDIPKIFLLFNLLVLFLYFIEHRFSVFQDFLRVNTAIISLYYILFHIFYLFGGNIIFSTIDIINIGVLGVLFYLFFRSGRGKKHIPLIASYTLIFIFLELSVFLKILFGYQHTLMMGLSFIFSILLLFGSDILKNKLSFSLTLSRAWGIIFGILFLFFVTIGLKDSVLFSLLGAILSIGISYIFFEFHKRFQNYISLFFASYGISLSIYIFYRNFIGVYIENSYVYIFLFIISCCVLVFDFFTQNKYIYDTYFFHIFSLLVNLSSLISFFFFIEFSILKGALFLLVQSLYFFFSYFSLRKNLKKGYTLQ